MMEKSECPNCAASIAPSSGRCDFCGQWFETTEKIAANRGGVNGAIQFVGKLTKAADGLSNALRLVEHTMPTSILGKPGKTVMRWN